MTSLSLQKYLPLEAMTELNVLLRTVARAGEEEVCEEQLGACGCWAAGHLCRVTISSMHLPLSLSNSLVTRLSELSLLQKSERNIASTMHVKSSQEGQD